MGIIGKLLGLDQPNHEQVDAFGKGRRVSARHAETWSNNRRGSGKSLAQQRKEHLAAQAAAKKAKK